jgi:hypothetical protein
VVEVLPEATSGRGAVNVGPETVEIRRDTTSGGGAMHPDRVQSLQQRASSPDRFTKSFLDNLRSGRAELL